MANTTYIVFLMQIGIAFVEAGSVRLKNLQFTLYKRCFQICIITLVWWLVGYGLAFGGGNNLMIGTDRFIN
jgi:Amt family ammonium transporter